MDITSLLFNIFGILVLVIIMLGHNLQRNRKDLSSKRFNWVIVTNIVFLVTNIVLSYIEGKPQYGIWITIVNIIDYILVDCVILAFISYLLALIKNKKTKKFKIPYYTLLITEALRVILIIVLSSLKLTFEINEAGVYVEKEYAFIPYLISGIVMIELVLFVLLNRKSFSKKQIIVIIIYELLPLIPTIIEIHTGYYSLSSMFLTLSVLMVFVLLKDTALEKSKLKQMMLEEISNTDLLTNLNNRRAFYRTLLSIDQNSFYGVVFCDINGLKYTNDNFGHAKGDELIQQFAAILLKSLDYETVFRISGDEFVAIIPNIGEETFKIITSALSAEFKNENYIAAIGFAYGLGSNIDKLIQKAELNMYTDKKTHRPKYDEIIDNK